MDDVVIVAAARTAIGKAPKGTLRNTRPDDLAAIAIKAAVERAGIDPAAIEDVVLGCAQPELEQGLDVARIAALRAGLPMSVPGATVNRFCASGLEAIAIAAQRIAFGSPNPRILETHPDTYLTMGLCVEQLAKRYGISREESDAFSVESHRKALAAQDEGRFSPEIVPVPVRIQEMNGAGRPEFQEIEFKLDEGPRRDTTLEGLAKLRSPFRADGIITAGNASQRSDGAAAVVLMSAKRAQRLGATPLLRFVGYAVTALEPENFGIGPALAIPKLLKLVKLKMEDVDLIEFNEAFAAQTLSSLKEFPLPLEKMNVNGGAIALGHPLGCTGARQTVTLAYEMGRRKARYGMVTMCAALGMGAAGLFERV
jgi:acetyl-CoA acyltransferase